MNLDSYLSAYLDRRMNSVISEWQISTRRELTDLTSRLTRAQTEIADLKRFERETADRLNNLEERIKILKERQK